MILALIRKLSAKPNPARDLAMIGVAKRKANVRAVARQMRAELGLPPHEALRS